VPVTQFATGTVDRRPASTSCLTSTSVPRHPLLRPRRLPIDKRAERRLEGSTSGGLPARAFYEMGDIEEHITALPDYVQHLMSSIDAEAIRPPSSGS